MSESFFLLNGRTVYARGKCRIGESGLKQLLVALTNEDQQELALLQARFNMRPADLKRVIRYIQQNMLDEETGS